MPYEGPGSSQTPLISNTGAWHIFLLSHDQKVMFNTRLSCTQMPRVTGFSFVCRNK